jgi:hypothetical protein
VPTTPIRPCTPVQATPTNSTLGHDASVEHSPLRSTQCDGQEIQELVVHNGPTSTWPRLSELGVKPYASVQTGWKFDMCTFAVTERPESDDYIARYEFNSNDNKTTEFLSSFAYGLSLGFSKYVHRQYRVIVEFRNVRTSKVLPLIYENTWESVYYRMNGE